MLSIQKEVLNLVYPFQGAGSCDSFLQHVTHKTQAAHLLVKIIHWLMHGDLEMLVGILKLLALPSICSATTCVLPDLALSRIICLCLSCVSHIYVCCAYCMAEFHIKIQSILNEGPTLKIYRFEIQTYFLEHY